jgi:hypothetical protein
MDVVCCCCRVIFFWRGALKMGEYVKLIFVVFLPGYGFVLAKPYLAFTMSMFVKSG